MGEERAGKVTLGKGVIRIRKVLIKAGSYSCQAPVSSLGTELMRDDNVDFRPSPGSQQNYLDSVI